MQDFIRSVVDKIGTSEETAKAATGGLLDLIQEQAGGDDAKGLLDKLPGAPSLLGSTGGGGALGGLAGTVGSALGGKLGAALGVAGVLKGAGLDAGKIAPFLSLFTNYIKEKAGSDLFERIAAKIPELMGSKA